MIQKKMYRQPMYVTERSETSGLKPRTTRRRRASQSTRNAFYQKGESSEIIGGWSAGDQAFLLSPRFLAVANIETFRDRVSRRLLAFRFGSAATQATTLGDVANLDAAHFAGDRLAAEEAVIQEGVGRVGTIDIRGRIIETVRVELPCANHAAFFAVRVRSIQAAVEKLSRLCFARLGRSAVAGAFGDVANGDQVTNLATSQRFATGGTVMQERSHAFAAFFLGTTGFEAFGLNAVGFDATPMMAGAILTLE